MWSIQWWEAKTVSIQGGDGAKVGVPETGPEESPGRAVNEQAKQVSKPMGYAHPHVLHVGVHLPCLFAGWE